MGVEALVILAGLLIHFAGLGPTLGGAVAVGGTAAVAGGRYLWNRRAVKRRSGAAEDVSGPVRRREQGLLGFVWVCPPAMGVDPGRRTYLLVVTGLSGVTGG